MGTKIHNNYEDLITFTRASGGHALRPVSYGSELVTNGTFDTDTTGWTAAASATLSVVNNELNVTNTTNFGYAWQEVTVEVGKLYQFTVDVNYLGNEIRVRLGTTQGGFEYINENPFTADRTFTHAFVATSTSLYIRLGLTNNTTGHEAQFDNVSVKEVTFDESDGTLTLFEHPDNIPRVEYDADGNRLGLFVEQQSTNLVQQSENFENVYWSGTSATPTINTVISPTGQTDGTTVTATGSSYISKSNIITSQNTAITFSAFLKAGTLSTVGLHFAGNLGDGANDNCDFDLSNGTVSSEGSSSTATIEDVGNGWYRCSNTYTTNGTGSGLDLRITTSGAGTYYVFGAQAETTSYKSSYIKTTGSSATRSPDVATLSFDNFGHNKKEITLFCDFDYSNWQYSTVYSRAVSLGRSTTSTNANFGIFNNGTNSGTLRYRVDNSSGTAVLGAADLSGSNAVTSAKVALAVKEGQHAITYNGNTPVTSTGGDPELETVDILAIGARWAESSQNVADYGNCHIKSIKYYPRRLTNAQLQEITS
jgi:hypothetical protein